RLPGPHRRLDPLSAAEGTGVRWALVRPARQPCYRSSSCSAIPVTVPTQGSQGPTAHPHPLLTLPAEPACVLRAPRATGAGWGHRDVSPGRRQRRSVGADHGVRRRSHGLGASDGRLFDAASGDRVSTTAVSARPTLPITRTRRG